MDIGNHLYNEFEMGKVYELSDIISTMKKYMSTPAAITGFTGAVMLNQDLLHGDPMPEKGIETPFSIEFDMVTPNTYKVYLKPNGNYPIDPTRLD